MPLIITQGYQEIKEKEIQQSPANQEHNGSWFIYSYSYAPLRNI